MQVVTGEQPSHQQQARHGNHRPRWDAGALDAEAHPLQCGGGEIKVDDRTATFGVRPRESLLNVITGCTGVVIPTGADMDVCPAVLIDIHAGDAHLLRQTEDLGVGLDIAASVSSAGLPVPPWTIVNIWHAIAVLISVGRRGGDGRRQVIMVAGVARQRAAAILRQKHTDIVTVGRAFGGNQDFKDGIQVSLGGDVAGLDHLHDAQLFDTHIVGGAHRARLVITDAIVADLLRVRRRRCNQ